MVMKDGDMVGMNMFNGYSFNERCFLSLAVVNEDVHIGDVLNLVWGEPDDSGKTSTETHQQTEIRVRVSPTPYAAESKGKLCRLAQQNPTRWILLRLNKFRMAIRKTRKKLGGKLK